MATDKNFIVKNGLDVGGNVSANSRYTFDYNNHYLEAGTNSVAIKNGSGNSYLIVDNTGVTVAGNLTVNGTQTILNTTTLDIEDKNITLNKGSGDTSSSANGAGITIQDAVNSSTDATITWSSAGGNFNVSHAFNTLGYLQHSGVLYSRDDLNVLNAAGNGWHTWANRNNGTFDLHVGTITGTSISGTSLSIDTLSMNGSSVGSSGNMTLDSGNSIILDADGGDVMLKDNSVWFGNFNHNGSNLRIDAKETNGNIHLNPNGTGSVNVLSTLMVGANTAPSSPLHVLAAKNNGWLAQLINTGTGSDANGLDIHAGVDSSDYILRTREQDGTDVMVVKYGGKVGIGITSPFSRLQSGGHTFSGTHGMHADSRVGISNHGALTGMMLASTYNDANHPEYGLVFVQGPSTSSYNVWSISPDGPAKGNGLNFHYGSGITNVHSPGNHKITFTGDGKVGIGTDTPPYQLSMKHASGPTLMMTRTNTNTTGSIGRIIFGNNDWDSSMASICAVQDGTNDGGKLEFKTQSDATGGEVTRFTIFRTGLSTFNGPASNVNLGGGSTGSAALYVNSLSTHVGEMFQLLKNGSNRLTILNNGNATFNGKITVETTDSQFFRRLFVKDGNDGLYMGQWDGSNHRIEADANRPLTIQAYNSGGITLGISGNPKLVVTNAGAAVTGQLTTSSNVGIGTTNPNSYSGQTTVTVNSTGVARVDLDISDAIQGTMLAESGYMGMFAQGANELRLGTSNTNRFIMNSIGNIRMGNVPPTALGPSTTTTGMHFQADHQRFTLGTHQNLTQQVFAVDGEMAATAGSSVTDAKASKGTAWAISSGQLFGPYTNIKQGTYRMSVRVRCNDAASAVNAMRMTVYTASMTRVTQRFVSCAEFETADQYQTFSIDFDVLASMGNNLELYVFPQNSKVLTIDYVTITNHHESYSPKHRGIVTAPNQPDFLARRSGSGGSYSPYTYSQSIPYNAVVHDHGGNFDTSTGLFTAPVPGTYLFQASIYSTATSSGGWNQAWLTINGARGNYTDIAGNGMDHPSIISTTHMVTLAIGDTVGYHPYGQNSTFGVYDNVHHTWFKGRLLG